MPRGASFKDNGIETAKRFLDYSAIEEYIEAENYKMLEEKYSFPPIDKSTYELIENEYKRVINKYGQDFKKSYGWAAHILKPEERNINQIAKIVGLDSDSGYYKLACNSIHSGSKSMSWRLGSLKELSVLAGASDFGQADAGINASRSLYALATLFFTVYPDSKSLIVITILNRLLSNIESKMLSCQEKIKENYYKM